MYCYPWKCVVNTRPCVSHVFSLGHFVKHFPGVKSHTFLRRRFHSNTFTDDVSVSKTTITSCFKSLSGSQQDQIHLYVETLLQWNQKMNLTASKEAEEVMERHIEDSLAILPPIKTCYNLHHSNDLLFDHINLVDVGSGAGLPGLVLAIACPNWRVTLMESINKRCVFLEHVVNVTGLTNVKIVRGRAESCGHDVMYREKFDVAIARAVAEMRVLAEYCLPLVRIGGLFVAAKGHDPKEEVRNAENAVRMLGGSILQISPGLLFFGGRVKLHGLPTQNQLAMSGLAHIPYISRRIPSNFRCGIIFPNTPPRDDGSLWPLISVCLGMDR